MMHCHRCGRDAVLRAGNDGGLYCSDCLQSENCTDCKSCSQRYCGVTACPFCPNSRNPDEVQIFEDELKTAQPIAVREECQRCGTPMDRVFVLQGKALCRDCLMAEQDRWEIVPAKPGKPGSRVTIILDKKGLSKEQGRYLFHSIGIDPDGPSFPKKGPISEKRMPDDECKNCPAYEAGLMSGKFLGPAKPERKK